MSEREEQLKRINSLLLPKEGSTSGPSEEAVRKSPAFIDISTKLTTAQRKVQELEAQTKSVLERWSATKGDLDNAKKSIAEMEEKHERRWNELVSQFADSDAASPTEGANGSKDAFSSAKRIADLESKLQQSIEAVNRMETLRATLADAYKMNETLQSKLDDLKTKNAKMVAEKSASRAAQGAESLTSPPGSTSKRQSISGSSGSDPTVDKLQRDYKRARKEVAAAVLSKDQAKLKQEVCRLRCRLFRLMS